MTPDQPLSRARRFAGRVVRRLPQPAVGGDAVVEDLRSRLRRSRARLKKAQGEVASLKKELWKTRESLRHPYPGFDVGDRVRDVIAQVREEKLTYLSAANLEALAVLTAEADRSHRPGLIVEAGTALGGSAIVMAAAKDPGRPMRVFDVFGVIPEPGERDGADVHARYGKIVAGKAKGVGGSEYYGYRQDLYTEVTESFARVGVPIGEHSVDLVKGLFQDTVIIDEPVALAHLDGDWYDSTMVCLERITPHLVPGGRIVLDDYWAWSGCRQAVDDFTEGRSDLQVERRVKVHIVKLA